MFIDGRMMQGYLGIDDPAAYLLPFGFVHNGDVRTL